MSRWVRVQADILDHPLFANSERSESDAWLWLITNAAWSATHHRIGNDVVPVPVGSIFVTLRGLAKEWNWKSEKRVRTFLRVLENHEMIVTKTDAGKTQVTICNYSKYQESGRTQDAERTQDGRTKYTNTPNTSSLRSDVTAQAPAKAKRGSRLPDDFIADISEAVRLGLSEHDAHREADKFRDYWDGQPGQRGVKLDWPATWRNWCRSAVERKQPRRNEPPPKPRNIGDAIRDEARRLGVLRDEPDSENRRFHSESQPTGNVRVLDLAFKPALKSFG